MKGKTPSKLSDSEQRIMDSARSLFRRSGYAAVKTRDIARAAGLNPALLNYYFRSKENLFQIVMMETVQDFFSSLGTIINHPSTTLESKITAIAEHYIEMLIRVPDLPVFIINEMRNHPSLLFRKIPVKNILKNSAFARQYKSEISKGHIRNVPILQFLMTLMGMAIFPFAASPMLKHIGGLNDPQFNRMMLDRKKLIPEWLGQILAVPSTNRTRKS